MIKGDAGEFDLTLPPVMGVSDQFKALAPLPVCNFKSAIGEMRLGPGTKIVASGVKKAWLIG